MSKGLFCVYLSKDLSKQLKSFIYESKIFNKTQLDALFDVLPNNYLEIMMSVLQTTYRRPLDINNSIDKSIIKDYIINKYNELNNKESEDDSSIEYYTTGEVVSNEEVESLRDNGAGVFQSFLGNVNNNLISFRRAVFENARKQGIEITDKKDSDFYKFITSLSDSIIRKLMKEGKIITIRPDENLNTNMAVLVNGDVITITYNPLLVVRDADKFDAIISHELLHTVTAAAVNNTQHNIANEEEQLFTQEIFDIIKDLATNENFYWDMNIDINSMRGKYKYIKEFIANVMSNEELREHLSKLKYQLNNNDIAEEEKTSVLTKVFKSIYNYIKSFYSKDTDKELDTTYLEKLTNIIQSHIDTQPSNTGAFSKDNNRIDQYTEGKVGDASSVKFDWDLKANDSYEVSKRGDKRFSAFNAKFKKGTIIDGVDVGGESIEDVYQYIIKKSEKGLRPSKDSKLYRASVSSYTGDITPDANTIFVFGSNPEGRHGAGAAKVAREKFGAIYGQGEGLQGNAYALPTKDLRVTENKGLRSISESQIIESIKKLYETARQNPDKQFKVAYRNTDKASLNGYTGLEMIDMFLKAGSIPTNIVFSKEWVDTGKFNLSEEDLENISYTEGYLPLWQEWAKQNPELIEDLRKKAKGKTLTDKFANTRVNQARALADILNLTLRDLNLRSKGTSTITSSNLSKNYYIKDKNLTITASSSVDYKYRTIDNIELSDVTIALASNFKSLGEKLTKKEAEKRNKYVSESIGEGSNKNAKEIAESIFNLIKKLGIDTSKPLDLNIAGNGIYQKGMPSLEDVDTLVTDILRELLKLGLLIKSVRSGGLTGVDEAGVKASLALGLPTIIHGTKDFKFRKEAAKDISDKIDQYLKRFNVSNKDIKGVIENKVELSKKTTSNKTGLTKEEKKKKEAEAKKKAKEIYNAPAPNLENLKINKEKLDSILSNKIPNIAVRRALVKSVYNLFNIYWDRLVENAKRDKETTEDEQLKLVYDYIFKGSEEELKIKLINTLSYSREGKNINAFSHILYSISDIVYNFSQVTREIETTNTRGDVIKDNEVNENAMNAVINFYLLELDKDGNVVYNNGEPVFKRNSPFGEAFYTRFVLNKTYLKQGTDLKSLAVEFTKNISINIRPLLDMETLKAVLMQSLKMLKHYDGIKVNFLNKMTNINADTSNLNEPEEEDRSGLNLIRFKTLEPSKRMSLRVRRELSKLPRYVEGEMIYDALGLPETLTPDAAYFLLVDKFSTIRNEQDYNNLIETLSEELPWFRHIKDKIDEDKIFRNEFYSAFRNTFNRYSIINSEGKISYLNGEASLDLLIEETLDNYESGLLLSKYSIYNTDTTPNMANISKLRDSVLAGVLKGFAKNFGDITKQDKKMIPDTAKLVSLMKLLFVLSDLGLFVNEINLTKILNAIGVNTERLDITHLYTTLQEIQDFINNKIEEKKAENPEIAKELESIDLKALFNKENYKNKDTGEYNSSELFNNIVETIDNNLGLKEVLLDYFNLDTVKTKINKLISIISGIQVITNKNTGIKSSTSNIIQSYYKLYLKILNPLKGTSEIYGTATFTFDNSPMPSYSAPSYTSDIMRHLNTLETEEDIENFKLWVEDNFTKYDFFKDSEGKVNHLWLRNILDFIENNRNKDTGKYNIGEIKEYAKNFNFTEVLGVGGSSKEKNGIGKVNNDTLLSGLVAAAFNSKYLGNTENSFGYFRNPLYSDKDILILFQVPMFTKEDYQDKVIDQLYKVWEAENKRSLFYAERQNNKNNAIDNLEKAGKKFHFFPEFNTDNFLEDLAIKESNGENIEEFIKLQLRILLNDYFENFYNQLDDTTIDKAVRINEGKNTSKEVTSLFEDDSLEEKTEEEKEEEKKKLTLEEQERRKNLLRQFYYNDFMNYIESIRLFQGDPALYGNSTALIKRGALSNVFGLRGYFIDENGNPITERCIYIEDYYADSNNMASIMELLRQDAEVFSGLEKGMIEGLIRKTAHYYEGICTTDGLSFRTIKSIKKILKGFGKLTKEIETSLDNIEKGTMTSLDITNVINSLKPFLYSSEARTLTNDDNINRTEKVVTLHKNSEYALSALYSILNSVLNKSNALKGLLRFMELYDIDVVHFKSVVKVGANNLFDLNNVYNPSLIEIINTRDNFSLKGRLIIFKLPIILSNKKETTEIPLDINTYNIIQEAVQNGKVSIIGKILNDILRVNVDKDSTLNKNQLYRKLEIYNAFLKQYKLESLSELEVYDSLDVLYRMDENGNYSPNIPNANKIHTFKLLDYVIVQPVDDHYLDHEAIFGSLLRNIVPANLPDNFTCTLKIKGKEILLNKELTILLYNTLITDLLIDSYNLNLHKKFSLIREFKKYIDDLISSNDKYGEDIYHALQLDESGTDFRVPFTSPNLSNKIDEIILSAAKNAIQRLKIKGGNIVLVSNFGFTSDLHVETETVEVTDEGGNITKQKRIKYIPCYAPMSMMLIYKDYLLEEDDGKGNIWYTIDFEKLKKNNISPKFLDMIGYRIPSENNYSIMPIRIMGILPQSMGSSIILPQDIISMSGTDFKQYWSL